MTALPPSRKSSGRRSSKRRPHRFKGTAAPAGQQDRTRARQGERKPGRKGTGNAMVRLPCTRRTVHQARLSTAGLSPGGRMTRPNALFSLPLHGMERLRRPRRWARASGLPPPPAACFPGELLRATAGPRTGLPQCASGDTKPRAAKPRGLQAAPGLILTWGRLPACHPQPKSFAHGAHICMY